MKASRKARPVPKRHRKWSAGRRASPRKGREKSKGAPVGAPLPSHFRGEQIETTARPKPKTTQNMGRRSVGCLTIEDRMTRAINVEKNESASRSANLPPCGRVDPKR